MPAHCHYSVCPTSTADVKTGSPTITISSGTATLSVAQEGNIGCGYEIDYEIDTGNKKCYIGDPAKPEGSAPDNYFADAMTSATVMKVVTAVGGVPGDVSGKTVNSIKAVWASLDDAVDSASDYMTADYVNNTDLTAGGADVVVHIWCYGGGTQDASKPIIAGATTDVTHYLEIRVPWGLDYGESVLDTNYHWGVWNANAYTVENSDADAVILVSDEFTRWDGLQAEPTSTTDYVFTLHFDSSVDNFQVANCVMLDRTASGGYHQHLGWATSAPAVGKLRNLILAHGSAEAIRGLGAFKVLNVLMANCTIYGCGEDGVQAAQESIDALNTAIHGSSGQDFKLFGSNSAGYNYSEDGTEPGTAGGSNAVDGWTPDWEDTDEDVMDFRLQDSSDLIGEGAGPDTESDCPALDIKGVIRSGSTCDIGAHQYVAGAPPAGTPWLYARLGSRVIGAA